MSKQRAIRPDEPIAYSVVEAARACRISRPTMQKLAREGQVAHVRIGRRVIISRQALEAFLAGGQK